MRTGKDIGAGWIDTTEESIERAKTRTVTFVGRVPRFDLRCILVPLLAFPTRWAAAMNSLSRRPSQSGLEATCGLPVS